MGGGGHVGRVERSDVPGTMAKPSPGVERSFSDSDGARAVGPSASDDRVLRAKYLDWCSARIAERFLQLTPDEIYELAQQASRERTTVPRGAIVASGAAVDTAAPWARDAEPVESFRWIVERVTEVLASTVPLPDFEEWVASYRRSPGRYDDELLGFWKEAT